MCTLMSGLLVSYSRIATRPVRSAALALWLQLPGSTRLFWVAWRMMARRFGRCNPLFRSLGRTLLWRLWYVRSGQTSDAQLRVRSLRNAFCSASPQICLLRWRGSGDFGDRCSIPQLVHNALMKMM